MENFDNDATYILGLYADVNGCACVQIKQKYIEHSYSYTIIHEDYKKDVSTKNILELVDFKNNWGNKHWYEYVYINNFPSLEKIVSSETSVKTVELNAHDGAFITKCLFNDGTLNIENELKESVLKNLNSYNPNDEIINHRVMALFLALQAYENTNYW
ncbi:MAG: hypothetical protein HC907_30820 [Richelia sp. SM1_7_0]|nr:hypothetical protein [Richelia sp. SM1_7_0]